MPDHISFDEVSKPTELHPKGSVKAVCVDVIDLGMVPDPFNPGELVRKIRLYWESAKVKETGRNFTLSKTYKLSLYDGARGGNPSGLFTDMSSWFGGQWNRQFATEMVMDRPAILFVQHKPSRQDPLKLNARVAAVEEDDSDNPMSPSGEYSRFVPTKPFEQGGPQGGPHVNDREISKLVAAKVVEKAIADEERDDDLSDIPF